MNKIHIGLGLLAAVIIGGIIFLNNSSGFVVGFDQDIDELQSELASLEAELVAGTLTPEAAVEAQTKIIKRLDSINNAAQKGQKAKLTEAQKTQLNDGLERLKKILLKYQVTLTAVDDKVSALPEAEKKKLKSRGSKTLTQTVIDTVTEAENVMAEIIEDYNETPIDELLFDEEDLEEDEMIEGDEQSDPTETDGGSNIGDTATNTDETQDDSVVETEEDSVESTEEVDIEADEVIEDDTATSS